MYKNCKNPKGGIVCNEAAEGKSIERTLEDAINQKRQIESLAPIIYTEKSAGAEAQYDIRTDKFEVALQAVEKMNQSRMAKRKYALEKQAEETQKKETPKAEDA